MPFKRATVARVWSKARQARQVVVPRSDLDLVEKRAQDVEVGPWKLLPKLVVFEVLVDEAPADPFAVVPEEPGRTVAEPLEGVRPLAAGDLTSDPAP